MIYQDLEMAFLKKSQAWVYSLLGGLLLTIMPLTVTLDNWAAPHLAERIASLLVLLVLVVLILYVSIRLNTHFYRLPPWRLLLLNLVTFAVATCASILIHYPLWMHTMPSLFHYYMRDELVRNIIIFLVSYMTARAVMTEVDKQNAQMKIAELERENLTGQVQGLMQQLNPHFLFNSLNTLSGIVRENPEKSERRMTERSVRDETDRKYGHRPAYGELSGSRSDADTLQPGARENGSHCARMQTPEVTSAQCG